MNLHCSERHRCPYHLDTGRDWCRLDYRQAHLCQHPSIAMGPEGMHQAYYRSGYLPTHHHLYRSIGSDRSGIYRLLNSNNYHPSHRHHCQKTAMGQVDTNLQDFAPRRYRYRWGMDQD